MSFQTITAFADEISPDLKVQVETLVRLDIQGLDLRSVDGVNVLDLSDERLREVRQRCEGSGIRVHSIGSPVNKVLYSARARREELEKLRKAIHAAQMAGTRRIRIFTPETSLAQGDVMGNIIIDWMAEQRGVAEEADVVLMHENDAKFWGAYPENAQRLFTALYGKHFVGIFDFANTVLIGRRPFNDWFPWMLPYLDTLHVKDAVEAERKVVPAGEGDGQFVRTLRYLKEEGWDGPLTLEPHLSAQGPLGGFSGVQLFEVALKALRKAISEVES